MAFECLSSSQKKEKELISTSLQALESIMILSKGRIDPGNMARILETIEIHLNSDTSLESVHFRLLTLVPISNLQNIKQILVLILKKLAQNSIDTKDLKQASELFTHYQSQFRIEEIMKILKANLKTEGIVPTVEVLGFLFQSERNDDVVNGVVEDVILKNYSDFLQEQRHFIE